MVSLHFYKLFFECFKR